MGSRNHIQNLRILLLIIGAGLVIYGAVMLLYFGNLVYQIMTHPEQVNLVNYILKNIKVGGPAMHLRGGDGQEVYIEFSETAKALGFSFLGIMGVGVLAGVVRAMVWGGVEIIKATLSPWNQKKAPEQTNR